MLSFFTVPVSLQAWHDMARPAKPYVDSNEFQSKQILQTITVKIPLSKDFPPHPDSIYWINFPVYFCVDDSGHYNMVIEVDSTELYNQLSQPEFEISELFLPSGVDLMDFGFAYPNFAGETFPWQEGVSNRKSSISFSADAGKCYIFWSDSADVEKEMPVGIIFPGAELVVEGSKNDWLNFHFDCYVIDFELENDTLLSANSYLYSESPQIMYLQEFDSVYYETGVIHGYLDESLKFDWRITPIGQIFNETTIEVICPAISKVRIRGKIYLGGGCTVSEGKNIKIESITPADERKGYERDIDGNP